jgi:GNAT superfamily N-acetyltransferase
MPEPSPTERITALPWDSEFFGVSIGKVDLNDATTTDLVAIDTEARDRGFDCVYGQLDPTTGDSAAPLDVQAHGHRLVEVNVLMARPDVPYEGVPTASTARIGTEADLDILRDSLDRLAPWSRFGADPRFGRAAARRMHQAWVERAIRDDNRMLAIAEDEDGVTGLSTQVDIGPGGTPCVDLMGVVKPGRGVSGALLGALVDWAPPGPIEAGPCAARNIAVLRFLERYDFSVAMVTYTYHWWRDGSGTRD